MENENTYAETDYNKTLQSKEYSTNELNQIRSVIESMNKFNQIEVLRILSKKNQVVLNENNYGVHVNLSELKSDLIYDLIMYINYVKTQETNLDSIEQQKESLQNIYFCKDNKEIQTNKVN
jgi:hypothetical protein